MIKPAQNEKDNFLCLLLACVGCVTKPDKGSNQEGASTEFFIRTFEKFGFSIKAPLFWDEDVPVSEDRNITSYFYSVYENPADPKNSTMYTVGVNVCEGLSQAEQIKEIEALKQNIGNTNVEKVLFSDNKYTGYVCDQISDGRMTRSLEIIKGKYIIMLHVTADISVLDQDALRQKFNKFTNSFKAID